MLDWHLETTVQGWIAHHARQNPEALCCSLRVGSQWLSYTRLEFWQRVERYAKQFSGLLPSGSLILFVKRLDIDLLAAYIGAMQAGLLPAQLSPFSSKTTPSEYQRKLQHIVSLTHARAIFTDSDSAVAENDDLLVVTPQVGWPNLGYKAQSSEEALVQFSSGSTGLQKGVVLTHRNLIAHMQHYSSALKLQATDRLVSWLPLYHDMGLIACFLMPLMCGIPFYQMDPFDWLLRPDMLLEAIEQYQGTICFLPNFAYHVLVNKGRPHDLGSMRLFVNCSEPARLATHEAFASKYPSVPPTALSVCYALAENTFAVSQVPPESAPILRSIEGKDVLSCGRILPGTEVQIFEANEEGVGEIAIRGECLFSKYLNGAPSEVGGFYCTGDLGMVTPEGDLFVTGRKKDLIITNGKNVYPQDIEHACSQVPGIYPGRVVAFGVNNEQTGSEDLVVVVERQGSVPETPLKIAVQKAVEQEVGVLPKRVEVIEHMRLVKTSSGKISRARNKELFLSGELR